MVLWMISQGTKKGSSRTALDGPSRHACWWMDCGHVVQNVRQDGRRDTEEQTSKKKKKKKGLLMVSSVMGATDEDRQRHDLLLTLSSAPCLIARTKFDVSDDVCDDDGLDKASLVGVLVPWKISVAWIREIKKTW